MFRHEWRRQPCGRFPRNCLRWGASDRARRLARDLGQHALGEQIVATQLCPRGAPNWQLSDEPIVNTRAASSMVQCDHIHLSGISASSVIASGVIDLSGAFQEEPQGLE